MINLIILFGGEMAISTEVFVDILAKKLEEIQRERDLAISEKQAATNKLTFHARLLHIEKNKAVVLEKKVLGFKCLAIFVTALLIFNSLFGDNW